VSHVFDSVVSFFKKDDWRFEQIQGKTILRMGFSGRNGNWQCFAQARDEQEQFIFYSIAPVNVPEDKRHIVAEFITRANYGMIIGNFEMDFSDGEIRYKTSIDVEGGELSFSLAKQMVYANVVMMDKYLPGIMAIIYAGKSPLDAVTEIEAP
jgi:hypothetical protein